MGSTTPLSSLRNAGFATDGSNGVSGQFHGWFSALSRGIIHGPLPLFVIGAAIIATQLLIIYLHPAHAVGLIFLCGAAASAMQAVVLLTHIPRSRGVVALRWLFFAITFSLIALSYVRRAVSAYTAIDFPHLHVTLTVLFTCFALFSLTLPSQELHRNEQILDGSIAIAFCALRFPFLSTVVPLHSPHVLERVLLDSGIQAGVALLAYLSARSADRVFFRTAAITALVLLIPAISVNEIGIAFLHRHGNALSLIDTVIRVGCALYFYFALFQQNQEVEAKPYRDALGSIVPFVLTALVVLFSAALLPTHPYMGYAGVTFGVSAFLLRIAFMSRRAGANLVMDESLLREIVSEMMNSEFLAVADRSSLESALSKARHSVGPQSPLSLILFWVDGISRLSRTSSDQKSRAAAAITQAISQWQTPAGIVCNMGDGMFVMLLPETPLRVARPLAEQICRSLDAIQLDGIDDTSAVAGVATCTEPSKMEGLLRDSSAALERAQRKQTSRARKTQTLEEVAAFDA